MNYNVLRKLIAEKRLQRKEVAKILEMTPSGFDHMMTNETMSVKVLQKACEHFRVPVSYFFENDSNTIVNESIATYTKQNPTREQTINLLLEQNNLVVKQVSDLIYIQKMNADTINKLSGENATKQGKRE